MPTIPQLPDASSVDFTDGATLILNNTDNEAKEATLLQLKENYLCNVHCASLFIQTADVLQLNSTPLEIVAAPGAGYAIEVISASVNIDFNSAAYATNTYIMAITSGATDEQYGAGILNATVSTIKKLQEVTTTTATDTQLLDNAALNISVKTGDPVTGDSDITVYVYYRIVEL